MKKVLFVLVSLLLSVSCGEKASVTSGESGLGENCTRTVDCINGLVCIDYVCVDPNEKTDNENVVDDKTVDDDKTVNDGDIYDGIIDEDSVVDDVNIGDLNEFSDYDVDDGDVEDTSYPKETLTSNKIGDIAFNITFSDEQNIEHRLEEWYYKNNSESKLIWLIFAAYDCPNSTILRRDLSSVGKKELVEKGLRVILIMNGSITGPNPGNEPAALVSLKDLMVNNNSENANHMYGYLKLDQQSSFYKFMNNGYPVNVFIDASNMEIVKHFEGWTSSYIEQTESFIVGYLD